jgi:molybdenum cofactor biosynthesis protein B
MITRRNPLEKEMQSASIHQHKAEEQISHIKLALITVSDSRTVETDTNGQYLLEQARQKGIEVPLYRIIPDEGSLVSEALSQGCQLADAVLFNGGTGISRRDTTFDILFQKFEKPIPGFGEIFRMLSYEQIGSAAILSRASAGIYQGKVVFCVPGSHAAVQLAWDKIISEQINHILWEIHR